MLTRDQVDEILLRASDQARVENTLEDMRATTAYLRARLHEYDRIKTPQRRAEVWCDIHAVAADLAAALSLIGER